MSQSTDTEQKAQELREKALNHDSDLFENKYKMHQIIDKVNGAIFVAKLDAEKNGGKIGNYISYRKLARLTEYRPAHPEEVCNATTISPELAMRIFSFFDQHPEKLAKFKEEMDQKYQKWEKWYLEKEGDKQKRADTVKGLAHNDENWQRETDALIAAQIYINDIYADLFSVFQYRCDYDENINAAINAIHLLGYSALPGIPDIFNPANVNKHCFVGQLKDINRYFKALFSRAHHISRKKFKTIEGFLYYCLTFEIENIHDMMYQNAHEIALASMLYWAAINNK